MEYIQATRFFISLWRMMMALTKAQMLENVEKAIDDYVKRGIAEIEHDGERIRYTERNFSDLIRWRDRLKTEIAAETPANRARQFSFEGFRD